MPAEHDQALCIRQWEWSETSQTAEVFCRRLGLVRGLAKGSRRPKSVYDGGLEVLTRGDVGVIVRPSSDLALLTEWSLVDAYRPLRKSLGAYHAGLYVVDLIHHAIRDHDPHPALYDAAVESLALIADSRDGPLALLKFQFSLLVETGYRPELMVDVATGEELPDAAAYGFSPHLGGFRAEPSRDAAQGEAASSEAGPTWRVRAQTLGLLRRLAEPTDSGTASVGSIEALLHAEGQAPEAAAVDRANRLLASYLRYVLTVEPPTMKLVFGNRLPR